jgi:hypothetical protein
MTSQFRADRRRLLFALLASLLLVAVFLPLAVDQGRWLSALVLALVLVVDLIGLRGWHDGRRFQRR